MNTPSTAAKEQLPLLVENVSKHFKEKQVLKNISFHIDPGEIFGVIGINGAGKTTLIKIILNLLRQDNGYALFFGNPSSNTESRRNIAYLPEKFQPSPFLKGKEFLSLALSFHNKHLDEEQLKQKVRLLDLDPAALDHKISKYSKGMGQKLGLISMFLIDPPLLILDEPMSGLDPGSRIQLKQLLMQYKNEGKTVFFSSHILADIEEICDRMAVVHNGSLAFIGKPNEFLRAQNETNLEKAFLKAIS